MSKIGFQCQFDSAEALRYNREVQPTAWMAINVVKPEWLEEMVAVNPSAHRIFRHHPNRGWAYDPERQAVEAVSHIGGMMAGVQRWFTRVTDNNEYILGPDHVSPELIALADRYIATFISTARAELGMGTCWGNFNVGHWGGGPTGGVEIIEHFPLALAAAQQDKGSPISFHEYNWRTLRDDTHSYTGKFVRAMPAILAQYSDVGCMVTELGIDRPSREWGADHEGYRMAFDDPAQAVDMFCGDQGLAWYNDLLNSYDWMIGALLFGCGMVEPWRPQGFDIMNHENDTAVMDRIKQFPVVKPEPKPNGGESMDVRIYDFDNSPFDPNATTATWEWLRSIFGSVGGGIVRHPIEDKIALQPGDVVYKLEWIDARVGDSSCVIHVEDVNGNSEEGKYPVFGWPDAEPHDLPDKPSNWTVKGVPGPTNVDGDVGPGMGPDSYYDAATERGAHFVWIWDLPSDMVDGIGMLTWHPEVEGNHLHVNLGYQAVVWEEEPPVNGELLDVVKEMRDDLAEIKHFLLKTLPADKPFRGEYFNNVDLRGEPVLVREDEEIDFAWGEGSPGPGIGADNFSVRWTGKRTFEAGTHCFCTLTDDGVRLWVDGLLLIDDWHDHAPLERTADMTLTAGQHDIKVEYYERGGGAVAKLSWEKTA